MKNLSSTKQSKKDHSTMNYHKLTMAFGLSVIALAACINGTVSDDITVSESVVLPGVATLNAELEDAGLPSTTFNQMVMLPTQSFSFDTSSAISKLNGFGYVSLNVKSSQLTDNNLDFIQSVLVQIQPKDNSLPLLTVSNYTTPNSMPFESISLPVENTSQLLQYLGEGEEVLSITLTVDSSSLPQNDTAINYNLVFGVDISTSQSISKVGKGN